MENPKPRILFVMVICAGLAGVCPAGSDVMELYRAKKESKTNDTKHPSAIELLDKYIATQDKFRSFISKSEDSSKWVLLSPIKGQTQRRKSRRLTEFRYDGNRNSFRQTLWGNISGSGPNVSKDNPWYVSRLWDDEAFYGYGRTDVDNVLGELVIDRRSSRRDKYVGGGISRRYPGHELLGYFFGDDERVDSVLRRSHDISIRDKTEMINGSECYVIYSETIRGDYTIWVDPQHGYNIAKAEVVRDKTDWIYDYDPKVKSAGEVFTSLTNVLFEKVDGVWVPMEAEVELIQELPRRVHYEEKRYHKRTEFILDPNHDEMGSFLPDDIKNGANVILLYDQGEFEYTWQDGKIIDDKGRALDMDKLKVRLGEKDRFKW
ncbi:MAG: hypothetical protein ACYTFK_03725 [Planctomycetota bacterium]|jgi:hypothetical protein